MPVAWNWLEVRELQDVSFWSWWSLETPRSGVSPRDFGLKMVRFKRSVNVICHPLSSGILSFSSSEVADGCRWELLFTGEANPGWYSDERVSLCPIRWGQQVQMGTAPSHQQNDTPLLILTWKFWKFHTECMSKKHEKATTQESMTHHDCKHAWCEHISYLYQFRFCCHAAQRMYTCDWRNCTSLRCDPVTSIPC